MSGKGQTNQLTSSSLADLVARLAALDTFTKSSRPQSFFDSTSCKICLSRLRSATNDFKRLFSSSSCFKRRSSSVPKPGELILPAVKGLLADAKLAADLFDRCSGLGLFEREGNLLVCEFRLLHRRFLLGNSDLSSSRFSHFAWISFSGAGQFLHGHLFGDNVHEFLAPWIYEGEGEMLGMAIL